MKLEDKTRFQHILDAAREINQYVSPISKEELFKNRMMVHSLVRLFEIIGEAANQISKETKEALPNIPWSLMIGMRNRLIHAYFDVDIHVVWNSSTKDIPKLIAEIEKVLK